MQCKSTWSIHWRGNRIKKANEFLFIFFFFECHCERTRDRYVKRKKKVNNFKGYNIGGLRLLRTEYITWGKVKQKPTR